MKLRERMMTAAVLMVLATGSAFAKKKVGPPGPPGPVGPEGPAGPQGPAGPSLQVVDANGQVIGPLVTEYYYRSYAARWIDGKWWLLPVSPKGFNSGNPTPYSEPGVGPDFVEFWYVGLGCTGQAYIRLARPSSPMFAPQWYFLNNSKVVSTDAFDTVLVPSGSTGMPISWKAFTENQAPDDPTVPCYDRLSYNEDPLRDVKFGPVHITTLEELGLSQFVPPFSVVFK